jgi:hypothetical protein
MFHIRRARKRIESDQPVRTDNPFAKLAALQLVR